MDGLINWPHFAKSVWRELWTTETFLINLVRDYNLRKKLMIADFLVSSLFLYRNRYISKNNRFIVKVFHFETVASQRLTHLSLHKLKELTIFLFRLGPFSPQPSDHELYTKRFQESNTSSASRKMKLINLGRTLITESHILARQLDQNLGEVVKRILILIFTFFIRLFSNRMVSLDAMFQKV